MQKHRETQKYLFAPTDLSKFVSCRHLTLLDREVAEGSRERPSFNDPYFYLITERGRRFEQNYVEYLESLGYRISEPPQEKKDVGSTYDRTITAMRDGYDIILQGRLEDENWGGYADILRKVHRPSVFGSWSYEVLDTKLATNTKAGSVLQLCVYTELLSKIQTTEPENMIVVKPGPEHTGFEEECFRYRDFSAYYRWVQKDFRDHLERSDLAQSYPAPVVHCQICSWWRDCEKRRRADDHLTYVAGIHRKHIRELEDRQISTIEAFARNDLKWKPRRGDRETYARLQQQATLQLKSKETEKPPFEFIEFKPTEGLGRLPEPNPGDVFFDIEADRFLEGGGLEYLLGVVYRNDDGKWIYQPFWAVDRKDERVQYEAFMDWIFDRIQQSPDLHIYHFAPYEKTALKRLMARYDSRGEQLDILLRGGRLVDLLEVVKESIRAGVEKYSIKDLEVLTCYERVVPLDQVGWALRAIQKMIEFSDGSSTPQKILEQVERYNEDDCQSTRYLRDWLEDLRLSWIEQNGPLERPIPKVEEASDQVKDRDRMIAYLSERLRSDLPETEDTWTEEDKARKLLSDLVGYFRREEKSAWWEYFRLTELDPEQMLEERNAIAFLKFQEQVAGTDKNPVHRYTLPFQELALKPGDQIKNRDDVNVGTIHDISYREGYVDIKKTSNAKDMHPNHVYSWTFFSPGVLEDALFDLAEQVIREDFDLLNPATSALLLKSKPMLSTLTSLEPLPGETTVQNAVRIVTDLKNSVLPVQGPPGTGKTYTAARVIVELARKGKRIGVSAVGHKVIENLLLKILEESGKAGFPLEVVHKNDSKEKRSRYQFIKDNAKALAALDDGKIVGGTSYLWARADAIGTLDYLFIDEAGQMSLAHVLATSRSAKNLILIGDPNQLEQPQQAAHPDGSDISALEHLLDGHLTIPSDRGLFLPESWRLHPTITDFISGTFYERRLFSKKGLEYQIIDGYPEMGQKQLIFLPITHEANQSSSIEEAELITRLVSDILENRVRWQDEHQKRRSLSRDDILIITPYNAQVALLQQSLVGMQIGTVDKFQGREAPLVIFSMASSSALEAPRGMRFLYHPNRLNVAVSRAKCAFILVGSPAIFEAECSTPEQMNWANVYCRFLEESVTLDAQSSAYTK